MVPEAWLRKYFGLVVLALVALAAWLSARGVTALLGARLGSSAAPPSTAGTPAVPERDDDGPDAASILARNPFDSVTGPLRPGTPPGAQTSIELPGSEPLTAPPCPDLDVRIVTEADDPRQSRAALQAKGDASARVVGVGDRLGDLTIAYIGFNPARRTPAVWLAGEAGLCQALLFAGTDAGAQALELPPPAIATPIARSTPTDLDAVIHKQSSTRVAIDRAAVERILADGRRLMPDSAILFEQRSGNVLGVRVFKVAPDSLLAHLGIQSGDRIDSVNGVHVTNRDAALKGYQGLRGGGPVEIQVLRKGKRVSIQLDVR